MATKADRYEGIDGLKAYAIIGIALMLIERNNLHEVDTWMFFKWVFKTFVAVMILTNTFNIVLAVFDVSQHVIQQSAGIIQNGTEITPDVLDSLRTELEAMELGPLFGLWLQSFLIQLTMIALNIVIFVIVYTACCGAAL